MFHMFISCGETFSLLLKSRSPINVKVKYQALIFNNGITWASVFHKHSLFHLAAKVVTKCDKIFLFVFYQILLKTKRLFMTSSFLWKYFCYNSDFHFFKIVTILFLADESRQLAPTNLTYTHKEKLFVTIKAYPPLIRTEQSRNFLYHIDLNT